MVLLEITYRKNVSLCFNWEILTNDPRDSLKLSCLMMPVTHLSITNRLYQALYQDHERDPTTQYA